MSEELRYPIGRFPPGLKPDEEQILGARDAIRVFPGKLKAAIRDLSDEQLDTPYRPGGWTIRQLVHHLADSHLNAYCRVRLALTEDSPTIRAYDQDRWAELPDARTAPIDVSLLLLNALHDRWTRLLSTLDAEEFSRQLIHPESGMLSLGSLVCHYGWHSEHHLAHILEARKRNGWGAPE